MAACRVTGLSPTVIGELIAGVGLLWRERHHARLTARPRRRAVGAGAKHRLAVVDRLPATLVSVRHGTTHDVPACWFGVDRSTITRAIGEVRPLPAQQGCSVAPEIRVRRPVAGHKDRDKFASGKSEQNAVKSMILTDAGGACCSAARSGRAVAPTSPLPDHANDRKTKPATHNHVGVPGRDSHVGTLEIAMPTALFRGETRRSTATRKPPWPTARRPPAAQASTSCTPHEAALNCRA